MHLSFARMWEQIEKDRARSPLMTSGEGGRAMAAVRAGKELHDDGETPFWDEFISLCSNAEGLSELLGVSPEKVRSWPSQIQEALNDLERHHANDPGHEEKTELLPTGDTGAFTTNSDPTNLGDLS
jgi:hypothetical protein